MAPSLSERPAPQAGIMCPLPGHLGHLYQGAWVGGGYHPHNVGAPSPPPKNVGASFPSPQLGVQALQGQSQLLTALLPRGGG